VRAKTSCCDSTTPIATNSPKHDHNPAKPDAPRPCVCCSERPDAALTESRPAVAAPGPTGERLPPASVGLAAGSPEHLGLFRGLRPPERAGVDVRSAALFDRHVLRC
jgi:hypothetical protein